MNAPTVDQRPGMQLDMPELDDLTKWQRDGLACALGGELLLLPARPGVLERLGRIVERTAAADERLAAIEAEVRSDGGGSLCDAVNRADRRTARIAPDTTTCHLAPRYRFVCGGGASSCPGPDVRKRLHTRNPVLWWRVTNCTR